ncbi:MAG TPA: SCO family protein [Beijerinckiaceae bacterium]|jgi:protein SCO1/2
MPVSEKTRRLAVPLAALLFGVVALAAAAFLVLWPDSRPSGVAQVGGPFTLVDHNGRAVTEKDVRGKPHLVFFGFTHCPDVCPTKLFEISEVLRATGERGRDLRALFITVDPERDTPEALKSYLGSFDERIVGLTGTPAAIEDTVRAFRAYARKVPTKDGDYTMEHTALVYLMDRRGNFVGSFNLNRAPGDAAQDILRQL